MQPFFALIYEVFYRRLYFGPWGTRLSERIIVYTAMLAYSISLSRVTCSRPGYIRATWVCFIRPFVIDQIRFYFRFYFGTMRFIFSSPWGALIAWLRLRV